jgi:hypothetical protein
MQTIILPTYATWNLWYIVGLVLQLLLVCDRVLFKPVLCVTHCMFSILSVYCIIRLTQQKTCIILLKATCFDFRKSSSGLS